MEIRSLRYFLAAAREENITRAARALNVTQPTLSRQIQALEEELGAKLFTRRAFSVTLTDEGILLRKRAADLIEMADKIALEFSALDDITGGDIYLGLAESWQIRHLARIIKCFGEDYPDFRYHITSGDTEQVTEKLDRGILDFAVLVEEPDSARYDFLELPGRDVWGLVFRAADPLARKKKIEAQDLLGLPLFISEQSHRADLPRWCGKAADDLSVRGHFRLAYNGYVFAREGLGYLLTFDHLVDTGKESGMVFRPLSPALENRMYLIWRRYHVFTPIAERFLSAVKSYVENYKESEGSGPKASKAPKAPKAGRSAGA